MQRKGYLIVIKKVNPTRYKIGRNCSFVIKVEFDVKFRTSGILLCKTKNISVLPTKGKPTKYKTS